MPSYSSFDIANYFLSRAAGEKVPISNLKLQKIVFIAHGFYLAITGEPLLNERIEAWPYGPVINDLYHACKKYGSGVISAPLVIAMELSNLPNFDDVSNLPKEHCFEPEVSKALEITWNACKNMDGIKLSNWTHIEGSPWKKAIDEGKTFIPDEYIKDYFKKYLTQSTPATA